jgi:hypothetical protein
VCTGSVPLKIAGCFFHREVSRTPLPVSVGDDISRREPSAVIDCRRIWNLIKEPNGPRGLGRGLILLKRKVVSIPSHFPTGSLR